MKKNKIGRGSKMSIAKSALLVLAQNHDEIGEWIYSGELGFFHAVIDTAGANHCGPATRHQVLSCLRLSPYWQVWGTMPGWGGRMANCYKPSPKGDLWLQKNA